jgi:hypothetical protein
VVFIKHFDGLISGNLNQQGHRSRKGTQVMQRLQSFRGLTESIIPALSFKDGKDETILTQYTR